MIEDALMEANRLDEGAVQVAQKAINGVKNFFNKAMGNGQQTNQGNTQQNGQPTQGDNAAPTQGEAKAVDLETIKGYLNDNQDPSDWPADRLGELVAFLKTQKQFMNSKKAQAALQAIQQQETKAEQEGKTEAPAENAGDPNAKENPEANGATNDSAAQQGNPNNVKQGDRTRIASILQTASKEDVIAYLNTLK